MVYTYSGSETGFLEDLYYYLYYGLGIAELGFAGILLMISIFVALASFAFAVIVWVLEAIPLFKLAKKTNRKYAWLAWVPVFGSYFRMYVLADIPGDKEVSFFGKFSVKSRSMAFWAYVGIGVFGGAIVSAVVLVASILIPFIGSFSAVINLVPWAATGIMEYVFLKDVLDVFKPDKKANNTAAIVITVLDNIATLGFARLIYLYTLLKCEPLPQGSGDGEEFVVVE